MAPATAGSTLPCSICRARDCSGERPASRPNAHSQDMLWYYIERENRGVGRRPIAKQHIIMNIPMDWQASMQVTW